jgi:hypothetical protein
MYPASVTFGAALVAGLLTAAALAVWPWARTRGRFAAAGVATLVGWSVGRMPAVACLLSSQPL